MKDYVINWVAVSFVVSFMLGAVLHWARARIADPTVGNLLEYWIGGSAADKGASACTLIVMMGTILTTLAVGLDPKSNIFMVSYNALLSGFAIDSFFQKTPPSTTTKAVAAAPTPVVPQLFPSGSGKS